MKRYLLALLFMLTTVPAMAERGSLTNIYSSWYTVTNTQTSITLPFQSRDITIFNADSTDAVCINFKGDTINTTCNSTDMSIDTAFIPAGQYLTLFDYLTTTIDMRSINNATASPVSVFVTY